MLFYLGERDRKLDPLRKDRVPLQMYIVEIFFFFFFFFFIFFFFFFLLSTIAIVPTIVPVPAPEFAARAFFRGTRPVVWFEGGAIMPGWWGE